MRLILAEFNELSPVLMEKFIAPASCRTSSASTSESEVYIDRGRTRWRRTSSRGSSGSPSTPGSRMRSTGSTTSATATSSSEKPIWDLLSDAGKRVWVCGSMNINYEQPINGWVLPDPWVRRSSRPRGRARPRTTGSSPPTSRSTPAATSPSRARSSSPSSRSWRRTACAPAPSARSSASSPASAAPRPAGSGP